MRQIRPAVVTLSFTILSILACGEAESEVGADGDGTVSRVPFATGGWKTDFSKHAVPLDEIVSGGPPKDGIPAIDEPRFVSVGTADAWLDEREPVVVFEHRGKVRGYPWQVLIWHEIVNDVVAEAPVTITYCPLCNTAIAFDRRVGEMVLDFGTTGKLRHSDLVMYDRQTETWWQQATGEAIVGELTGTTLEFLSAPSVSWGDFKRTFPEAEVLSRETGHRRPYGTSPYSGYDTGRPWLFRGPRDDRLEMMERVVVVRVGDAAVAYPLARVAEGGVVNHRVGREPIAVFYRAGTSSAVDAEAIARGRDVGAVTVYSRRLEQRILTFRSQGDGFRDDETGSRWNLFGEALEGPLKGSRLQEVVHFVPFWFAWAAFAPETPVYGK